MLATDASPGALAVAARNAARHDLRNVRFAEGGHDWYAPLQGARFDLIASNPPYIASDDPHLEQGDLRFEPATALASGPDGLDDIRRIVDGGQAHLLPGGWLLIEHGWDQGEAIRALFDAAGLPRCRPCRIWSSATASPWAGVRPRMEVLLPRQGITLELQACVRCTPPSHPTTSAP